MGRSSSLGRRVAPPRFLIFLGLFAGLLAALTWGLGRPAAHSSLVAFDVAAIIFLGSLWPLFKDSVTKDVCAHAAANDANRVLVLIITFIVVVVILVAVGLELTKSDRNAASIALVIGTLVLAWLFTNMIYALHYAHLYYGKRSGGLEFPGTKDPDYQDFLYFAATMGMTFQTSDVAISDRTMRRVATWQAFAAFIFNMGVIAFTINIIGGA